MELEPYRTQTDTMETQQNFDRGKLYASFIESASGKDDELGNLVIATGIRNHEDSFEGIPILGFRAHIHEKLDWRAEEFMPISKNDAYLKMVNNEWALQNLVKNLIWGSEFILEQSEDPDPQMTNITKDIR